MSTAENIDDKKLYLQAQSEIASLSHELAQLKKLIFGSRQERFIVSPAAAGVTQGTLGLPDEIVTI